MVLKWSLRNYSAGYTQAGAPETAAKSVTPIGFTCGSFITKGQIQVCVWRISLAYTSNILLSWKLWKWGDIAPVVPLATRLVATVFGLQVTDQRRHSRLSEVYVPTALAIQINLHNYQQSWQFSLHSKSVYCVHNR